MFVSDLKRTVDLRRTVLAMSIAERTAVSSTCVTSGGCIITIVVPSIVLHILNDRDQISRNRNKLRNKFIHRMLNHTEGAVFGIMLFFRVAKDRVHLLGNIIESRCVVMGNSTLYDQGAKSTKRAKSAKPALEFRIFGCSVHGGS